MKSFAMMSAAALMIAAGVMAIPANAVEPQAPLSKKEVKQLIQTAKSGTDHLRLADYYRYEQKRLESEVAEHREMAAAYHKDISRQPVPKYPTMGQHCETLMKNYADAAREAGQLAAMHEKMAKDLNK